MGVLTIFIPGRGPTLYLYVMGKNGRVKCAKIVGDMSKIWKHTIFISLLSGDPGW